MKRNIYRLLCGSVLTAFLFSSCSDILEEQPRSSLTPDLFKTEIGLESGLAAAYTGLRWLVGAQGPMFCMELGTDEFTSGASNTNWTLDMTPAANGTLITSETGDFGAFWTSSFQWINTCNGVIDYGTELNLSPVLIAEARCLRAYYYFNIVQMFGAAPLDLGAGNLKFNTSPSRTSVRNSVDDVYAAIIADLDFAVANLPVTSRKTGTVNKKTALHFLAKAYLTKGDYTNALKYAEDLITNQASYGIGLEDTYAKVFVEGNEHGKEILMTCEHSTDFTYNGFPGVSNTDYATGVTSEDRSSSYFTVNYPTIQVPAGSGKVPVGRSLLYARPWIRMAPTNELLLNIFGDKTNDSRYYSTFQTVWLRNAEAGAGPFTGLLGQVLEIGDTAYVFPGEEVTAEYRASKNYRIITPSEHARDLFPSMMKFFDTKRHSINGVNERTFMVAKFSETYLIAAEAAVRLNQNDKARNYILTLRKRAAFPGHEDAMVAATPATITIDYILDERSRELCGEQMRWLDLIRTGKWIERCSTYTLGKTVWQRDIKSHYVLRPIPQSQLDRLDESIDRKAYQNPGYSGGD